MAADYPSSSSDLDSTTSTHLRRQLQSTTKGRQTCLEYFERMMGIASRLSSAGSPVSESDLVAEILSGLGSDFDDLFSQITTRAEPVTVSDLLGYVQAHEARLLSQTVELSTSSDPVVYQIGKVGITYSQIWGKKLQSWNHCIPDILGLTSNRLEPDLCNYIRFHKMCKDWQATAPIDRGLARFPWLVKCDDAFHIASSPQENLEFYYPGSGEIYKIRVEKPNQGIIHRGPADGYLLFSSTDVPLYLLNPLTGNKVLLPEHREGFNIQVFTSQTKPISDWHLVTHIMPPANLEKWAALIYHKDQNNWLVLRLDKNTCKKACITCLSKGRLYATDKACLTCVYDAESGEKLQEVPPPEDENTEAICTYLVDSCGDILRVILCSGPCFAIYKLSSEGEGSEVCWKQVTEIGNHIIFLDRRNGFTLKAPPGFIGNHIYFKGFDRKVCRYSIGDGTVETVPCPFKHWSWFVPSLI